MSNKHKALNKLIESMGGEDSDRWQDLPPDDLWSLAWQAAKADQSENAEKSGVWQFFQDGEWHVGSNTHNHRENTEAAGIPTRDLYVGPPKFSASVNHEPVGEVQPMLLVNFEDPNDAKSVVLVDPELPLGTKVYLHPADPKSMVIDLAMKDAEYTGIGMFKMDSSGSITRVSPSDRLKSN